MPSISSRFIFLLLLLGAFPFLSFARSTALDSRTSDRSKRAMRGEKGREVIKETITSDALIRSVNLIFVPSAKLMQRGNLITISLSSRELSVPAFRRTKVPTLLCPTISKATYAANGAITFFRLAFYRCENCFVTEPRTELALSEPIFSVIHSEALRQ